MPTVNAWSGEYVTFKSRTVSLVFMARAATDGDRERTRLLARSYQWLTRSQRRRLQVLDGRAVLLRYPWLARAEAARHASKPTPPKTG
jgi:hypothetical protein